VEPDIDPRRRGRLRRGIAIDVGARASQTVAVSVLPGVLTVAPAADSVTFAHNGNGHGKGEPYRGTLGLVKVVDARGSLVGWNASVSLQGIEGLTSSQLVGAQLCATPGAPTIVAGMPGEVRGAKNSCGGVGGQVSIFYAPPGGGGGTFTDTADLKLTVPLSDAKHLTAALAVTEYWPDLHDRRTPARGQSTAMISLVCRTGVIDV
jgi:hypothetical protein